MHLSSSAVSTRRCSRSSSSDHGPRPEVHHKKMELVDTHFGCFRVNCMTVMQFRTPICMFLMSICMSRSELHVQHALRTSWLQWSYNSIISPWRQDTSYFWTSMSKNNIHVRHDNLCILDLIIDLDVSYMHVCIVNIWCWTWHYETNFHDQHDIVDSNWYTDIELCGPAHSWRRQFERVLVFITV